MTEEKVKRGEELLKCLGKLKDQKSKWERGERFFGLKVIDREAYNALDVDDSFVDFDEVKLLAIARISRKMEQIQKEFDEL